MHEATQPTTNSVSSVLPCTCMHACRLDVVHGPSHPAIVILWRVGVASLSGWVKKKKKRWERSVKQSKKGKTKPLGLGWAFQVSVWYLFPSFPAPQMKPITSRRRKGRKRLRPVHTSVRPKHLRKRPNSLTRCVVGTMRRRSRRENTTTSHR